MAIYYSYKLVRDFGFAPNPFHGICTLATCKPNIRQYAQVGDWVFGCGAKSTSLKGRMIYLMRISEKLTFEEYSQDQRFQIKRPIMNAGLIRMYGDNIYAKGTNGEWKQARSQHSNPDGSENKGHSKTDLSGKYVLISDHFFYFGNKHIKVPNYFKGVCSHVRDRVKVNDELAEEFIQYIKEKYSPGVIGDPIDWHRYNQKSLF